MPATQKTLPALALARSAGTAAARLRALRTAAAPARDALLADGPPKFVRDVPLITLPYPSSYAFSGLASSPAPFVFFKTRMHVVAYVDHEGAPRTLVFNPADRTRDDKAPFYVTLTERYGALAQKVLATVHETVEGALERLGIAPGDVDYVAFDHLHVRDARRWVGSGADRGFFPHAKLLVLKAEWECARDLHPLEVPWYIPGGTEGIAPERVEFIAPDAWLGRGVALVWTPGHTDGNMSLAVTTSKGVCLVSENGVATEAYAPERSRIPGIAHGAKRLGQEVVLNGNTRVQTLEQYSSMVLERELAKPLEGDVPLFFPSSELVSHALAPGLSPTFSLGPLEHGVPRTA